MMLVPYKVVTVCCSSFHMILVPYKVVKVHCSSFHVMLGTYKGFMMLVLLWAKRPLVSVL